MTINITSEKDLDHWLEGAAFGWDRFLALRAIYRALPILFDRSKHRNQTIEDANALSILRDVLLCTASFLRSYTGYLNLGPAYDYLPRPSLASEDRALNQVYIGMLAMGRGDAADASGCAARAIEEVAGQRDAEKFWEAVSKDCSAADQGKSSQELLDTSIWPETPEWFASSWAKATRYLSGRGSDFSVWREWIYGRIQGYPRSFSQFDARADREFYNRIFRQDVEWWMRDPAEVNADIKALVDSLRIPKPPSDEELTQNPRAFTFSLDAEGRSELDEDLLPNGLQGDADERDNHGEVLRLIEHAVIATAGDTNAKDMADPTELLRDAIGANIEELRPRLFILRARELIRQVKERESGTSMHPQLSEKQRDAYLPLVAALEMIAEFSPKLAELWNGKLGQTGTPLTRETLDLIALALRTTGQTTELAQSIVEASNRQVAPDAPEDDPARIAASETSRNVVRKMGGGIKKAGDGARAIESIAKLIERGAKIWRSVKDHLPAEETITRILEWMARGGGSGG
ncbi:MAG: hypothetical protein ACX930_03420 [Erythrobacter sp.]